MDARIHFGWYEQNEWTIMAHGREWTCKKQCKALPHYTQNISIENEMKRHWNHAGVRHL